MERIRSLFFYLTIFIVGAAVLVVEIAGTRAFAPFYGSTIYVWSSLISVTMIFLAAGYAAGGRLADVHPNADLIWYIILGSGLFLYAIPFIDNPVIIWSDQFGIKYGPLVASTILFAAPLFLFGLISPLAIKIRTQRLENLGMTAGNLYALATFGSLVGALVSGFYLAPNYSFTAIMQLMGVGLIIVFVLWQIINLKTIR